MMGQRQETQQELFYQFSLEDHSPRITLIPPGSPSSDHWSVCRSGWHPQLLGGFLQPNGSPLGRSRISDPHAAGRILLRHPIGSSSVAGVASELGIPLVLSA